MTIIRGCSYGFVDELINKDLKEKVFRLFAYRWYILCSFFIFFNQILNAYVSEAEAWRHFDSGEVVYLLYDIHELPKSVRDEDKDIHCKDRKKILHFVRSTNSSLIVEDPSTLTDEKFSFTELHKKFNGDRTSMHCITSLAYQDGLLATGVEFRPGTVKYQSMVTIAESVDASEGLIKRIKNYRDGELLNKYYVKGCALYTLMHSKCKRLFQRIADQDKGTAVNSYKGIVCPEEAMDVLRVYYSDEYVALFNSCEKIDLIVTDYNVHLLDMAMMHALSEHLRVGRKSTVMFAGSFHLRKITPILTQMGYRLQKHYVEKYATKKLFDIDRALKKIEPSYDPNAPLPKTAVDYFIAYKQWEAKHPTLKKFVPAYTIAVWFDYYKDWKQEESVSKKAVPVAIAGTALAIVCVLIKLYCGSKS